MDEVLLRDAHVQCLGHPRDERIVFEVATTMLSMGHRPMMHDPRARALKRQHDGHGAAVSSVVDRVRRAQHEHLAASGRGSASLLDDENSESSDGDLTEWSTRPALDNALRRRAALAEPALNVEVVQGAFESAYHGKRVAALPLYKEDVRTSTSSRAPSALRDALQSWLDSEGGQAWVAEKKRRMSDAAARPSGSEPIEHPPSAAASA